MVSTGDFASAEYTISVELGRDKKEIIKCLLTASNEASVVVYGRASTTTDLAQRNCTGYKLCRTSCKSQPDTEKGAGVLLVQLILRVYLNC